MRFSKVSVLALAGAVAASPYKDNTAGQANAVVNARDATITEAPVAPVKYEERDILDSAENILNSGLDDASTFIDGVESKAGSYYSEAVSYLSTKGSDVASKAGSLYSDAASHVSTAIDGAETWISTKIDAASSAVDSAAASASAAADGDNAAPGTHGRAGAMAVAIALGATAFGFLLV